MPANKPLTANTSTNASSYPHANDVVALWLGGDGTGTRYLNAEVNNGSASQADRLDAGGAGTWAAETESDFDQYGASTSAINTFQGDIGSSGGVSLGDCCYEFRGRYTGGSYPSSGDILSLDDFATTSHTIYVFFNGTGGSVMVEVNPDDGGGDVTLTLPSIGTKFHLMINIDNASNSFEVFLDGVSQGTSTTGSLTVTSNVTNLVNWNGAGLAHELYLLCVYNDNLSSTEVSDSFSEPYAVAGASLSAGAQTLTVPAIASGETLYAPAVAPQAVTVNVPAIASGETLYAPAVSLAQFDQTLTIPAIASTETLHPPAFDAGAVSVALPAIPSGETLYPPAFDPGAATVSVPAIASAETLHPPTFAPGAVTLALPAIASTETLYPPTLATGDTLVLPAIASTETLHPPTFAPGAVDLEVPAIAAATVLYAPSISQPSVQAITVPFISSGSVLHPPGLNDRIRTKGRPHDRRRAAFQREREEFLARIQGEARGRPTTTIEPATVVVSPTELSGQLFEAFEEMAARARELEAAGGVDEVLEGRVDAALNRALELRSQLMAAEKALSIHNANQAAIAVATAFMLR